MTSSKSALCDVTNGSAAAGISKFNRKRLVLKKNKKNLKPPCDLSTQRRGWWGGGLLEIIFELII